MSKKKSLYGKNLLTTLLSFLFMLIVTEVTLRLLGYEVWKEAPRKEDTAQLYEFDQELGWKLIPGSYEFPAYDASGKDFKISISDDRQRIVQNSSDEKEKDEVLFIGGSFTFGWGISDNETMAWKLQEQNPTLRIKNLAVSGFGSYQSLLRLENELKKPKKPSAVIYGFIEHHKERNVAHPDWIAVSQLASAGRVKVPHLTLNNENELIRHEPIGIINFPLRKVSVLARLSQKVINRLLAYNRIAQQEAVLNETVLQMNELCKKQGIQFFVTLLGKKRKVSEELFPFLESNNVSYLDCSIEEEEDYQVPGDGHPNGKANSLFAQCIQSKIMEKHILK